MYTEIARKISSPGQRVQIDVKFVSEACIVGDTKLEREKFHQYKAIDEYSRFRYLEAFSDFKKQLAVHCSQQKI